MNHLGDGHEGLETVKSITSQSHNRLIKYHSPSCYLVTLLHRDDAEEEEKLITTGGKYESAFLSLHNTRGSLNIISGIHRGVML